MLTIPDGQNFRQKLQALDVISTCTPEESSQWALSKDHRWSLRTPLMRKWFGFLIFPIQFQIERKFKTAGTIKADQFGTIRDFLQRAVNGTSFDVRWSLVAQAIPEKELFLSKMSEWPTLAHARPHNEMHSSSH